MPTAAYGLLVVVLWMLVGVTAAAVLTARRGRRERWWYWLGALLGLLFVPIAIERMRQRPERVQVRPSPESRRDLGRGLKVLVAVDGSTDADRALQVVCQALVGSTSELVLMSVVDPDLADGDLPAELTRARELLADRSDRLPAELPAPAIEVATGPPADALLEAADARDVDLIVVGRHGGGRTRRLLGSVAERVAHGSPRAVLLGGIGTGRDAA